MCYTCIIFPRDMLFLTTNVRWRPILIYMQWEEGGCIEAEMGNAHIQRWVVVLLPMQDDESSPGIASKAVTIDDPSSSIYASPTPASSHCFWLQCAGGGGGVGGLKERERSAFTRMGCSFTTNVGNNPSSFVCIAHPCFNTPPTHWNRKLCSGVGLHTIHIAHYCIDGFQKCKDISKKKETAYYKTTTQSQIPNFISITSLAHCSLIEQTTALRAALWASTALDELRVNSYR